MKRVGMASKIPALVLLLGVSMLLTSAAFAEEDKERVLEVGKWYPQLESGINITQSAYSDNWSGGDKGSIVWSWIANGVLENKLSKKTHWLNTLKLAYGQTHQQDVAADGQRNWAPPEKSTDLIDFESLMRFTLGAFVDPYVSGRFESRFQDASDPLGRTLSINPMKFKESAGIAKQFIDEEDRSLLSRLGFTFRQGVRKQFVDEVDPFDDETTSESTNDGGLEMVTDYKAKILEDRVSWTSKLGLYQPIFYSGKDELEDAIGIDPHIADYSTVGEIDWENIFTTQITKLISVNLYTRWVYDKYDNSVLPVLADDGTLGNEGAVMTAIRKEGQFKQTLGIGITYRFL